MAPRGLRAAVLVSLVVLVTSVTVSTATTVLGPAAVAVGPVLFTLFTGGATVVRPGSSAGLGVHTGDHLADGDTVRTGDDSKAALLYPDGSVTRLDSDTTVTVRMSTVGGGLRADLAQTTGLTWNRIKQLTATDSFKISGPNSTAAEVRGTEFGYYVEYDPGGNPLIWVDVWSGRVQVTGPVGPPVTGTDGQRVTVRSGMAAAPPVAIPLSDRQLSFVVLNQALDATAGRPVGFAKGTLSSGATSAPGSVRSDGGGDLQFVLAWPGSTYRLTVRDPSGAVFASSQSATPPLIVNVPSARAGTWTYVVDDVQSGPQEAWWVVVGRTPH